MHGAEVYSKMGARPHPPSPIASATARQVSAAAPALQPTVAVGQAQPGSWPSDASARDHEK